MKIGKVLIISMIILTTPLLVTNTSFAANVFKACSSNSSLSSTNVCSTINNNAHTGNPISNIINSILNIFSYVAGILTVILMIVSGFRYSSSSGDSNKVTQAKQTLTYALIGLAFVIISRTLMLLVFSKVKNG